MSNKLIDFFLISLCCIIIIVFISAFCYDVYLYYYDYDTYIKWLDTVRPFRFRWTDNIDPFICLAIAIVLTIISRKLRKITQGDITLK